MVDANVLADSRRCFDLPVERNHPSRYAIQSEVHAGVLLLSIRGILRASNVADVEAKVGACAGLARCCDSRDDSLGRIHVGRLAMVR